MQFDDRDAVIRDKRLALWNERTGPRVGDYCIMPDGEVTRFTHDWGDDIQTVWKGCSGSFYFGDGYMSFSGGLDSALLKSAMTDTGELRDGYAWFFHHDHAGGGRGVYFTVPCRVFRYQPQEKP